MGFAIVMLFIGFFLLTIGWKPRLLVFFGRLVDRTRTGGARGFDEQEFETYSRVIGLVGGALATTLGLLALLALLGD
jgi:hypothetical protein